MSRLKVRHQMTATLADFQQTLQPNMPLIVTTINIHNNSVLDLIVMDTVINVFKVMTQLSSIRFREKIIV